MKGRTASRGVFAICIDAPNMDQLKRWMTAGYLPALRNMAERGVTASYNHIKRFRNDRCWDLLLGGRDIGGAGSLFCPGTYDYYQQSLQREDRYEPFYALGRDYRVCMFDLPATLSERVNGIQVFGWGSELNAATPVSMPEGVLRELVDRYGPDPKLSRALRVLDRSSGDEELSYVIPDIYDHDELVRFRDNLITSVERRTAICEDLIGREDWDLFLAVYPEIHTANHLLWHMGESYPVSPGENDSGHAVFQTMRAVDRAIHRLQCQAGPEARFIVYTLDQTTANSMDVPSMALLPELLFRWNFPGCRALSAGCDVAPAPGTHWKHRIWATVSSEESGVLESPTDQEQRGDALSWNPANWYRPLWPQMRAFALPSVADGYIRLNCRGREAEGQVAPEAFQAAVDELRDLLARAEDPDTGRALVQEVVQIRRQPHEQPDIPPDLVVKWNGEWPACSLYSPDLGRIGPFPYFRSGGHVAHGTGIENLLWATGPGIEPGSIAGPGCLEDVPASILDLLGVAVPETMTGRSLFRVAGARGCLSTRHG